MKKRKFIIFIISCLVILFSFSASACDSTQKYADEAKNTINTWLENNDFDYSEVLVEYYTELSYDVGEKTYNYTFYKIIVVLKDTEIDYSGMYNLLTNMPSISYSNVLFMEYVKHNDILYQIDSADEFVLQTSNYTTVYNSIAAKAGVDLTAKEKARIYKDMDNYYTKMSNGKYVYTESEAEKKVAEKYNVTTSYLKTEIWNYTVWQYYQKYYN